MRNSRVEIKPLTSVTGAEIRGIDLNEPLSDIDRNDIRQAIHNYGVVFFRDQNVSPAQHAAFAARFGEVNMPKALFVNPLCLEAGAYLPLRLARRLHRLLG